MNYNLKNYFSDLDELGLKATWDKILSEFETATSSYGIFNIDNFGYLYEEGLAYLDKQNKKESGKYFTPVDIANLMSEWLVPLSGENICDVCCGTGNLIISYLHSIGNVAFELLEKGKVWLYDIDPVAMSICAKSIELIWGLTVPDNRCIVGDFLDKSCHLPDNSKVICNPPYFKIGKIPSSWQLTDVLIQSKEFYSSIMEKILKESAASVIITPYSFIGGTKFFPLRLLMNNYNGLIVSFDNVPGNIFHGKKHGRFNSNHTNSTRAAITVTQNKDGLHGYRVSGLIRFKSSERDRVINKEFLNKFIGSKYQIVSSSCTKYAKCLPELENIMYKWFSQSFGTLKNLVCNVGEYRIYVPNTCRYYTVASKMKLERVGIAELRFSDEKICAYVYCLLNSSFGYWFWRLYDGGITYPFSLLLSLPSFYDLLTSQQKDRCFTLYSEMVCMEDRCLKYKKNAGTMQENICFPREFRDEINNIFLEALGCSSDSSIFDIVHANSVENY